MVKNEIGRMYCNCGDIAVAVVAVRGAVGDWATYIGGCRSTYYEIDAVVAAAEHGCKLSEKVARAFFPHIKGYYRP